MIVISRRCITSLLPTLALVAIVAAPASRADDETLMRTEDVVRMLVSGNDVATVVSEIRARPVEFDLSEDIVDELRIAGVPEDIITAMQERQAELHPGEKPAELQPPVEEIVTDTPLLVIEVGHPAAVGENDPPGTTALYFPGSLPAAAAKALQLGDGNKPVQVEALAIFVACRTSFHVPDYWRSKTPLGRDFVSMPRHRMVAFHRGNQRVARADLPKGAAARVAPVSGDGDYIRVELPRTLEATIDLNELHDLSFGVAIEAGGRFLRIVSDDRDDFELGDDAVLRVRAVHEPTEGGFGINAVIVTD